MKVENSDLLKIVVLLRSTKKECLEYGGMGACCRPGALLCVEIIELIREIAEKEKETEFLKFLDITAS